MKFLIFASFLISLSAFANNEELSCKTASGDVEFTREWLVVKTTDAHGLFDTLEPFRSEDSNAEPRVGDALQFKSSYEGQPGVKILVRKASKPQKVAGEENNCGVGFETDRFKIEAEIESGEGTKRISLTCLHYLGYHGHNCH
ncbi:MAG: hypothetical protein ACXWQO_06860 [Bdellovibrionota bacterium]